MGYLCPIFVLVLSSFTTQFALSNDMPSAYEVLQEYDFPIGLLPKGVTGYKLNRDTGEFSAYLNATCKFSIESYQLEYKSTITGVISRGRLSNLKGVRVLILFLWINIVEVVHDGEELEFSVGIASANFPIDNFGECPQCGCGFECNLLDGGNFVSSFQVER
ncbi:unnamed protein product [Dovyalis caffra]|uniref:Uncharacterized protein n=1 Tax=Dovyalis caffra TaxID=77055 RepID=A0AAV1SA47_9ROSI|nr:unnamed protein product [Dovyalis caffra]